MNIWMVLLLSTILNRHNLTNSVHLCAVTVSGEPEPVDNVDPNEHHRALLPQSRRSVVPEIITNGTILGPRNQLVGNYNTIQKVEVK